MLNICFAKKKTEWPKAHTSMTPQIVVPHLFSKIVQNQDQNDIQN